MNGNFGRNGGGGRGAEGTFDTGLFIFCVPSIFNF